MVGATRADHRNREGVPKLPGFSKVCTIMFSAIEKALSNQATPTDSLNQAATEALDAMTQAGAYQ